MSEEWVSAAEALDIAEPGCRHVGQTSESIYARAKAGLVRTQALRIIENKCGKTTKSDNCPVAVEFWGGQIVRQDWMRGEFSMLVDPHGMAFMCEAFGVRFAREDIVIMNPGRDLRSKVRPSLMTEERRTGGAQTRYDWEGALIALIALANNPDGLPTGPGANARLVEVMAMWFQKNGGIEPSQSALKQRAAKILNETELARKSQ